MIKNVAATLGMFRIAVTAVGISLMTGNAFGQAGTTGAQSAAGSTQPGGQPAAGAPTTGAAEAERVIVTGSNIPTAEEVGPNPVLALNRDLIEKSGERQAAELPPPAPGQPGPFSLGEPGVIEDAYARAGFSAVEVRRMAAPLRLASTAECLRFEQESFGALHQMLAGLSDEGRADAWAEIEQALGRFEGPGGGFEGPCELIIAAGTREAAP